MITRSARASTLRRNRQADLLRGFEVDDELELDRLFHRQICWRRAFQNLVHVGRGAPEQVVKARAVAHEPAVFDKLRDRSICRRESVFYRKFDNLRSVRVEDGRRQQEDGVSAFLACGLKRGLDILSVSNI